MSNANKSKDLIKEVRPNAVWDALKWTFGQIYDNRGWLIVVIGYLLTLGWQWFYNIPVSLQAFIVLIVLWTVLIAFAVVIRYFWASRQSKEISEEASDETNDLSILPEKTEYDWLIEYAQEQEQKITGFLVAEHAAHSQHNFDFSHLNIIFVIRIFNKSVFTIAFEDDKDSVSGEILLDGKPFLERKLFSEKPPKISRIDTGCIRIEQRLSKADVDALNEALERYERQRKEFVASGYKGGCPIPSKIELRNLVVMVKGSKDFPQVSAQPLGFPYLVVEVTRKEFNLSSRV